MLTNYLQPDARKDFHPEYSFEGLFCWLKLRTGANNTVYFDDMRFFSIIFAHHETVTAFYRAAGAGDAPAGAGRQGAGRRCGESRPETDVVQYPLLQARRRRR